MDDQYIPVGPLMPMRALNRRGSTVVAVVGDGPRSAAEPMSPRTAERLPCQWLELA
jgi:hypothetical protein